MLFSVIESESDRKIRLKHQFIKTHLLKDDHFQDVEMWFEYVYDLILKPHPWWKLKHLLSIPPLARDWTSGFTPILDIYADDLTSTSYQLKIRKHIIGREQETALIERTLSKSDEANVVLVGEEGVGKMTIINLLAKKMYEGKTNSILAYKRLLRLNMEKILNEHTDTQKRELFLEELMEEAAHAKNVIFLIENFELYTALGENHVDLSVPIEKYASTDRLQIIGITTPFLYESYVFTNSKIRSIVTKVDVTEVSKEKALLILLDKAISFESRYKLYIPYETVLAIIEKSNFYVTSIPFPEKALQLLDNVCIYTNQTLHQTVVLPETVDTVLTKRTHIPTSLTDKIKNTLMHLEELMQKRIFGQDESIKALSSVLRRSFLLMGKRKKPLATFLFLGPTGVGKTETAKVVAEVFFGSSNYLTRFDMSEYQSKDDISSLIGSIQKLNPGLLTNAIREHPYGVLLLDEIEKAHPDLLNIFLTILDEGYYADGYGQRVDCKNLVIIATSNAGAQHIHQLLLKQSLGNQADSDQLSSNALINYLIEQNLFSPEFLNRFDGVIAYRPLEHDTAETVAQTMIDTIKSQIFDLYKVHIQISDETIHNLTQKGYDVKYGARNLERVLRESVEDKIAKIILEGNAKEGDTIQL
ncbi:MAG: Negative regulator of genetic competence ClpC/mecB [Candidatus Roizmanbacteria bacterium GW2011_GWA2_37_7]|uniref:Negative regulator of genetic competence ClpC/mecB n=1 Tax=Candidatus Roizmanbacteria bacterium GW2011_GWA2_37_7 TaxID=1618481 RepID=A0A0G0H1V9_9BACT|nr:MAG: Negative regulator of genetic competence ClpC/mecB [Candidatus Roizmanbacteria bacterium GW2011_GWA2_37_7]